MTALLATQQQGGVDSEIYGSKWKQREKRFSGPDRFDVANVDLGNRELVARIRGIRVRNPCPNPWQCGAIAGYPSAGINRHAVGNERVLQERSSEPPDLESCGGGREAAAEA